MGVSLLIRISACNMKTNIRLNHVFQPYADNRETVEVDGNTVMECLAGLAELYPVFREILFDNEGTMSVIVQLRDEIIVPDKLDRPVSEQDELLILPMLQGG